MSERRRYTEQVGSLAVQQPGRSDNDRTEEGPLESEAARSSEHEGDSTPERDAIAGTPTEPWRVLLHAHPATLILDDAGRFLFANESAKSLLEYVADEIVDKHFSEICEHDLGWLEGEFHRLKSNRIWIGCITLLKKTGGRVNVGVNAFVLPEGRLPGPTYIALIHPVQGSAVGSTPIPQELPNSLAVEDIHVLQLLVEGLGLEEMAVLFQESEPAVQTHIDAVCRKLGVRSRTQACIIAIKRHLVG